MKCIISRIVAKYCIIEHQCILKAWQNVSEKSILKKINIVLIFRGGTVQINWLSGIYMRTSMVFIRSNIHINIYLTRKAAFYKKMSLQISLLTGEHVSCICNWPTVYWMVKTCVKMRVGCIFCIWWYFDIAKNISICDKFWLLIQYIYNNKREEKAFKFISRILVTGVFPLW